MAIAGRFTLRGMIDTMVVAYLLLIVGKTVYVSVSSDMDNVCFLNKVVKLF